MVAVDKPRDQQRAEHVNADVPGQPAAPDTDTDTPDKDTPVTAGALLAAARAAAGMSVDEVSARTRIRATLIRQMEQDDFAGIGGAVYTRGHIRGIARALGADPEPIVAAFEASHPAAALRSSATQPIAFDPLRGSGGAARGGRRWGAAMVVTGVIFCIVLLITLLRPGPSHDHQQSVPTPSPTGAAAPARAAPPPATTPPPTEVNLRLEAVTAPSWLQVSDVGGGTEKVLFQQILTKGASQTVTADALQVKIGNAGAMSLNCNGQDLGSLGGAGQVVTVQLGLGAAGACTVNGAPTPSH